MTGLSVKAMICAKRLIEDIPFGNTKAIISLMIRDHWFPSEDSLTLYFFIEGYDNDLPGYPVIKKIKRNKLIIEINDQT